MSATVDDNQYNKKLMDGSDVDEYDDDSKNNSGEEFESEDEYEDDDDDDIRKYLLEKEFLKQHAFAIFVAMMGAAISHFHLIPMISKNNFSSMKINKPSRKYDTSNSRFQHHSYARTENIKFCPFQEHISLDETHEERIRRVMYGVQNNDNSSQTSRYGEKRIDKNLQLFQFNLPKEFVDIMGIHYLADQLKDDNYNTSLTSQIDTIGNLNDSQIIFNEEFKCLLSKNNDSFNKKSTIEAFIPVYISPDFSTFFQETAKSDGVASSSSEAINSVKEAKQQSKNSGQRVKKPAALAHTGFAAKFVNLSPKELNLYWDGNSGHKKKLVGTIQPFEAIGTATFPGNSFYVAPLYDKEYALKRWVVTSDNAVLVYDPYGATVEHSREKILPTLEKDLSSDQILKYRMQLLNLAFGREYLAQTRRTWLSTFPKPNVMYHMWSADHFGQEFQVRTKESQFLSLPSDYDLEKSISYKDHYTMNDKDYLALREYRSPSPMEMKIKVISVAPRVFEVPDFLSPVEVKHILDLTKKYNISMNESTLSPGLSRGTSAKGDLRKKDHISTDKNTRSSTNAWIDRELSPIVDVVYRRVASLLNIDESLLRHRENFERSELATHHSIAEAMQLVHYGPGQQYTAHHDFLYPSLLNRFQPSRFVTVLMYLNDVKDGGETVFPRGLNEFSREGITIKPKAGKIIFFYNVLPDGNVDDLSQHASLPVLGENEEKWIANLWVWDPIID